MRISTRDRLSIIMAAKKMSGKHSRRWTESEINLYAVVLAEPENQFAESLEKLALKKQRILLLDSDMISENSKSIAHVDSK